MTDPAVLLARLVAFDSRNPEGLERPLLEYCHELLARKGPDELVLESVPRRRGGAPTGYVYARFGRPRLLFNAHVDTVPTSGSWSGNPFELRASGDRLIGLGASDTKGSAAALLAAVIDSEPRDVAILLSGDEEFGNDAMAAFLSDHDLGSTELAIVCEPTDGAFATEHRGIMSWEITAQGSGGHSSRADDFPKPVLELSRVALRLDEWAVRTQRERQALCLNIAEIKTGAAFNVIPSRAALVVSARPAPGVSLAEVEAELLACVREVSSQCEVELGQRHASFRIAEPDALTRNVVEARGRTCSVPFWTEAALFSQRGVSAVVYGPGEIGQAHAADESLDRRRLFESQALFERLLSAG